ncbi:T9SS type A sorting domain-containing protein [Flavobacteriaceae bacterium]|nr:T9SS type A sorting domain-containing protein [Flavobacteriaceae bacterium]
MRKKLLYSFVIFFVITTSYSQQFWVVTNSGSDIYTVEVSDGSIISSASASALNLAANPIDGFMGMAQHPITEEVFVLFRDDSGDRYIGRLNTATGEIITEGQTETSLNSIAFDASGVLYAMQGYDTGDGETMQIVDIYTAPETAFHTFTNTNGGDMDAIAFNTTENLMYRFDAGSSGGEFLSLNLETLEETVIADLSFDFDTWGGGLAYRQGQNKFLLGTGQTLYNLLADGTISTISTVDITGYIKGLLNAPNSGEFWVVTNSGSDIYTVNISDGSIISSVSASALNLAANPIDGFMGMAQHPITEEVFVLFRDDSGDRYIGRLNTATGEIITEGQTETSLNSIAFDASGVLYAMQGYDTGDGETMQIVDIYTAPETAFHTFTNTNGGDMDAIAFNTTENLMYRFDAGSSGGEFLSLNLETLEETVIADLSFDFDTWGGGLAYRQGQNKFLLGTGQTLYNLLADGTISTISTVDITGYIKGLLKAFGSTAGVNDLTKTNISIYPNPTNNIINVNLGAVASPTNYSLYSIDGKMIVEHNTVNNNSFSINLTDMAIGIYILKIKCENSINTFKIIKK